MFLVWIIGIIISTLVFLLWKTSKVQEKKDYYDSNTRRWKTTGWTTTEESLKISRISIIGIIILAIVPLLNIVAGLGFLIMYIYQYYDYWEERQGIIKRYCPKRCNTLEWLIVKV